MAFIGATPAELRTWLASVAHNLEDRQVVVSCSGAFSIEQIVSRRTERAEIHGNDVTLYSCILGCLYSGQDLPCAVRDETFAFVAPFLESDMATRASAIVALSGIIDFARQKNDYQIRMWRYCVGRFAEEVRRIREKLALVSSAMRLHTFTMRDGFDIYPRPGAVAICFPPTYVGGYERMFKRLEAAISWPAPSFEMLSEERRETLISRCMEMDFILYDDRPRPGVPCVAALEKPGRKKVWIYSNMKLKPAYLKKRPGESVPKYPLLMPDTEITRADEITLVPTTGPVINHYRNMFLSKRITPGAGGQSFLLFAGDRVFGALMFLAYSVKLKRTDEIYLMSDFALPSGVHKRLAKLVLMCCLSRDMRTLIEKRELKEYRSVLTSVFTTAAVSMKYRGIFELDKRGEGFLNYRGLFADYTLQEARDLWLTKYEKR